MSKRVKEAQKIHQKFPSILCSLTSLINLKSDLSEIDNDILETDEGISMSKLNIIESKKLINFENEFPFQLLIEVEKIYEESIKKME